MSDLVWFFGGYFVGVLVHAVVQVLTHVLFFNEAAD